MDTWQQQAMWSRTLKPKKLTKHDSCILIEKKNHFSLHFRMKPVNRACVLLVWLKRFNGCWTVRAACTLCTLMLFTSTNQAKILLHLLMHVRSWMEIIAPSVIRLFRYRPPLTRSNLSLLRRSVYCGGPAFHPLSAFSCFWSYWHWVCWSYDLCKSCKKANKSLQF